MGIFQPKFYEAAESVDASALMIWQIPNESGDPWVPVRLRGMSMASLITQVAAGGITTTAPLAVSAGNLSILGLTTVGNSNQVVMSDGSAWSYVNSTGTGSFARAVSPTFTGTIQAASINAFGNIALGTGSGGMGSFVIAATSDNKLGFFDTAPQAQPQVNGTAFPNPVTDTAAFITMANQVLGGLLQLGVLKNV